MFQSASERRQCRFPATTCARQGKGFPDLNTRQLLRLLTLQLKVPALALVDGDPHGLEIFFVYKYGSLVSTE